MKYYWVVEKPFIDFYTAIRFAPTEQMSGINLKHKNNRSNLYRKLGLRSSLFKNAKVLEIGAGSGENAIDILTRGISSLTIFDGAQVVLDNLKANIKSDIPTYFKIHDFSYP